MIIAAIALGYFVSWRYVLQPSLEVLVLLILAATPAMLAGFITEDRSLTSFTAPESQV